MKKLMLLLCVLFAVSFAQEKVSAVRMDTVWTVIDSTKLIMTITPSKIVPFQAEYDLVKLQVEYDRLAATAVKMRDQAREYARQAREIYAILEKAKGK